MCVGDELAETKTVYSADIKDWGWGFDGVLDEGEVLRPGSGWLCGDCLTIKVEVTVKVRRQRGERLDRPGEACILASLLWAQPSLCVTHTF